MPQPQRASIDQILADQLITLQRAASLHHEMMIEWNSIAGFTLNDSQNGIGGFPSRGTSKNEDYSVLSQETSVEEPQAVQHPNSTDRDAHKGRVAPPRSPPLRASSKPTKGHTGHSSHHSSPAHHPAETSSSQKGGMAEPLLATAAGDPDDNDTVKKKISKRSGRPTKTYNHVFTNQNEVKENVEELLAKITDSPEDHYNNTGIWQDMARSEHFQHGALAVIVLNCLWLAVDTEYDHANFIWYAPNLFWTVDNVFCFIFTAEIFIRLNAFKYYCDAFLYGSFIFDAVLVGSMIWDTWVVTLLILCLGSSPTQSSGRAATVLRVLRIFRIFRIARVVRLLNKVPDLAVLVKGMIIAMRATMSVLMLLGLVIYIFSVVFMQLLHKKDIAKGQFNNFGSSFHLLLMQVICGPDSDMASDMLEAGFVYYFVFLVYLLIAQLTIMNMLIGILCDVVATVSEGEKEQAFEVELNDFLETIAEKLDTDGSGTVSKVEFDKMFEDPETAWTVTSWGMDVVSISDYAAFIFSEVEELTYPEFFHMLSQFRTSKPVTMKDLMDLRKYLVVELSLAKKDIEGHQAPSTPMQLTEAKPVDVENQTSGGLKKPYQSQSRTMSRAQSQYTEAVRRFCKTRAIVDKLEGQLVPDNLDEEGFYPAGSRIEGPRGLAGAPSCGSIPCTPEH